MRISIFLNHSSKNDYNPNTKNENTNPNKPSRIEAETVLNFNFFFHSKYRLSMVMMINNVVRCRIGSDCALKRRYHGILDESFEKRHFFFFFFVNNDDNHFFRLTSAEKSLIPVLTQSQVRVMMSGCS